MSLVIAAAGCMAVWYTSTSREANCGSSATEPNTALPTNWSKRASPKTKSFWAVAPRKSESTRNLQCRSEDGGLLDFPTKRDGCTMKSLPSAVPEVTDEKPG